MSGVLPPQEGQRVVAWPRLAAGTTRVEVIGALDVVCFEFSRRGADDGWEVYLVREYVRGSAALARELGALDVVCFEVSVGRRDDVCMTTIYMPMRCYGPPNGHYGWLFEADGRWYAGSLEMPDATAPQWLQCKATFDS